MVAPGSNSTVFVIDDASVKDSAHDLLKSSRSWRATVRSGRSDNQVRSCRDESRSRE